MPQSMLLARRAVGPAVWTACRHARTIATSPPARAALPVLDAALWRRGGSAGRDRFAAEVKDACEKTGFFYLSGHGMESDLAAATTQFQNFFALPRAVKEGVHYTASQIHPPTSRGWQTEEFLDPSRRGLGDTKESFQVGLENPLPSPPSSDPFLGPNIFPDEALPEMRPRVSTIMEGLHEVSLEMCRAFGRSLDLPDQDFFAEACSGKSAMVLARALYYPEATGAPDEVGCSAHSDYGVLTLLHQTGHGLQVLHADGSRWLDVPPLEGCLVCNIADLMQRWTNDRYVSSVHRVMVPPGAPPRYSFGFFLDAKYGTCVEPLAQCCSEERPARYEPIIAGDHKISKTRIQYAADVSDAENLFLRTLISASANTPSTPSLRA